MKPQRYTLLAAALVVLSNLIALAGVAYNRGDAPESTLALSERELSLPYGRYAWSRKENSGLALQLVWRANGPDRERAAAAYPPHQYSREAHWLDETKLRSLGFDLPSAADQEVDQEDWGHGGRPSARDMWLVLELDGPAYQHSLKAVERWVEEVRASHAQATEAVRHGLPSVDSAERDLRLERHRHSRLFAVDAGLDAAALRAAYPDRSQYAIVRGRVHPGWWYPRSVPTTPRHGHIESIEVDALHVSTLYRAHFDRLSDELPSEDSGPRYAVEVSWGRRFEPWIAAVKLLAEE